MKKQATRKNAKATNALVSLDLIEIDHSTQTRAAMRPEVIEEYREAIDAAAVDAGGTLGGQAWPFPPVHLFLDGEKRHWIGDGFHRIAAALAAGLSYVVANVEEGDRMAALRHACSANCEHGLRRTNEDIRRAIELADEHWPELTDNALATLARVSNKTVTRWRPKRVGTKVTSDGRELTKPASVPSNQPTAPPAVAAPDPEDEWVWVAADDRPTIGEVEADVAEIPTWGELAEGSGAETRERDGVIEIRRDLIIDWCALPGPDGKTRWSGFRRSPVSIEHATREREKAAARADGAAVIEWAGKLRAVLLLELANEEVFAAAGADMAALSWRHATDEARKIAAQSKKADIAEMEHALMNERIGDWIDAVVLLVGTDLHASGPEGAEQRCIPTLMEALA